MFWLPGEFALKYELRWASDHSGKRIVNRAHALSALAGKVRVAPGDPACPIKKFAKSGSYSLRRGYPANDTALPG